MSYWVIGLLVIGFSIRLSYLQSLELTGRVASSNSDGGRIVSRSSMYHRLLGYWDVGFYLNYRLQINVSLYLVPVRLPKQSAKNYPIAAITFSANSIPIRV